VILLLRFIGVVNAAVWFGAAAFFTFAVAPTFFTPEMKKLLGDIYGGLVAQLVLERYFMLHYWCGGVALLHLLAEWVYLGKALQRVMLWLLIGILGLGLLGGLWLQPKLKRLHQIKYGRSDLFTSAQKASATRSFRVWHGVSQAMNLLVLGGLVVYYWRTVHPNEGPRFVSATKFRS
jgi:hypothetical protein